MMKVVLVDNAWNNLQDADAVKHILGITARTEGGKVVEVRVRHNDGEEFKAKVSMDGEPVLPMDMKEFEKAFAKKKLDITR